MTKHVLVEDSDLVLVSRVLNALGPVRRRLLAPTVGRRDSALGSGSQNSSHALHCALALENARATNSVGDDALHRVNDALLASRLDDLRLRALHWTRVALGGNVRLADAFHLAVLCGDDNAESMRASALGHMDSVLLAA